MCARVFSELAVSESTCNLAHHPMHDDGMLVAFPDARGILTLLPGNGISVPETVDTAAPEGNI